jgi:hypothetical protein
MVIISLLLVPLAGAAVMGVCRRSDGPVAVKLVAVESAGRSNIKSVIVEFTRRGLNWVVFAEGLKMQARVGNRWLEPQSFPELADTVLLWGTNRENVRFLIPRVAAVLALWLGYFLGYRHGLREERRAWEATEQASLSSVTNRGIILQGTRISYSNPHLLPLYYIAQPTGRAAERRMNVPDPRAERQYEHSSP